MDFWSRTFLDNSLRTWATAVGATAISLAVFWLITSVALRYLRRFSRRTETDIDDLVAEMSAKTKFWLLAIIALYVGVLSLTIPPDVGSWLRAVAAIAALTQVALWGDALLTGWLVRYQKSQGTQEADELTTVKVAAVVVRFAFFILVGLIALDNIPGVQVTTLIASLGIGGIAVALAVQNVLGDLFASLIIVLDRPFSIGDVVKVDDFLGTVEAIGLKTTHVRSYTGEEVIFGNNDLLGSRLRNYRDLAKRLVISSIGVSQSTPYAKLARIPDILRGVVEPIEFAQFARASFSEIGASSFDFQLVFSTLTPEFGVHMAVRQAVNLGIVRRFEEEGIELAYPTQVVLVGERAIDSSTG
jgi:small-conductance mechanosensitive channel